MKIFIATLATLALFAAPAMADTTICAYDSVGTILHPTGTFVCNGATEIIVIPVDLEDQLADLQDQLDVLGSGPPAEHVKQWVAVDANGTLIGTFTFHPKLSSNSQRNVTVNLLDGRPIQALLDSDVRNDRGFIGRSQRIYANETCSGVGYFDQGRGFESFDFLFNAVDDGDPDGIQAGTHYVIDENHEVHVSSGPFFDIVTSPDRISVRIEDGTCQIQNSSFARVIPTTFVEDLDLRFVTPFHAEFQ